MNTTNLRPIDHIALPVPSLADAREFFTKLGFTVAPDARHKFGSENACVNFSNGTFLEPLAIGDQQIVDRECLKGNTFLRVDAAFRFRHGAKGISMLAFHGKDAKAERLAFQNAGYDTGKLVTVRRPGVKVGLAFAIDPRGPDTNLFLCERPNGAPVFPDELATHANGAKGISRLVLHEREPGKFSDYLRTVCGAEGVESGDGCVDFNLPNGTVSILNDAGAAESYGKKPAKTGRALRIVGFDIAVADLTATKAYLEGNSIPFDAIGIRLVVKPSKRQDAIIAFIEG